jgi:hypothetical protein
MQGERLQKWALTAEIISAIAVVLSLLFLAVQIRASTEQTVLNTKAVQTAALQQHFSQHSAFILAMLENPEIVATVLKGREDRDALSPEENVVFTAFKANQLRQHFFGYELMKSGLMPTRQWRTFERALEREFGRGSAIIEIWDGNRDDYPSDFQKLVDDIISAVPAN